MCLVLRTNRPMKMTASRCQESDPMNSYEIAGYAKSLPEDQRDSFARYALRTPLDRVRNFVRYQMQMRRQGFTPLATPKQW